jgi:hypothetical protein
MSLVNDALKRAKEAQQPTPAPPISGPPFKEMEEPEESGNWIKSPITMAVVAIIALIVIWQSLRHNTEASRGEADAAVVAARSNVTPETAPATAQHPAEPQPPAPASASTTAPPTNEVQVAAPATTNSAITTAESQPVVVTPPVPPPLKLQAVIWNPKRPSAIINGQTVFVGDAVRGLRVSAITRDTATLDGTANPEVLRLAP